jgi:hypothetical protein
MKSIQKSDLATFMHFKNFLAFISSNKLNRCGKILKKLYKKIVMGWFSDESVQHSTGPAQTRPRARGRGPEPADQRDPAVSRTRGRSGMGLPGPFDQVVIDGPRSSPTSDRAVGGGNPRARRDGAGAHLGTFPGGEDRSRRRGGGRRPRRGAGWPGVSSGDGSARRQWRSLHGSSRRSMIRQPWVRRRVGLVSYCLGE